MSNDRRRRAAAAAALLVVLGGCTPASTGTGQTAPTTTAGSTASAANAGSPTPTSTPTPGRPAAITIVGSGDILLHPPLWEQASRDARLLGVTATGEAGFDFAPLLAGVRRVVAGADLAICHLETPIAPAAGPFSGYPRFSVPPQIAVALAGNGYDICTTASNHTIDQGEAGVLRTLDALDKAGIEHSGSYRTKADHSEVTTVSVRGVLVASLSYTFSFNGLRRPAGKQWLANLVDPATILAEAKRARAVGAEIVVVSLHFGTEYQHAPNAQQRSLARTLLASPDIDLILGHHAHVVQPFEKIGDKWVAYGLGNKVAHHAEPRNDNREGVLARFTFTKHTATGRWVVTSAEAVPVWMDLSPDRLVNIAEALDDPSTLERATLLAAWRRIRGHLVSRGAGADGLLVSGT